MKRQWLPTQKGTDLFPTVIQPPTKLIIKDVVPGTELYNNIAQEYAGQIRQFHAKAQQTHALSVNQETRIRQQFDDDARINYTNILGQERLVLEVSRTKLKEKQPKPVPEDYWDFCLIELFLPDGYFSEGTVQLQCWAYLSIPPEIKLPADLDMPIPGFVGPQNFTEDKLLRAAYYNNGKMTFPVSTVAQGTEDYAAFLLDMRGMHILKTVAVQLYPYMQVREEMFFPGAVEYVPLPVNDPVAKATGIPTGGTGPMPALHNHNTFSGYDWTTFPGPFGSVYFNSSANEWQFTYNNSHEAMIFSVNEYFGYNINYPIGTHGDIQYVHLDFDDPGFVNVAHDHGYHGLTSAYGHNWWWNEYHVYGGSHTAGYGGPNPIPAEVHTTMFKGEPPTEAAVFNPGPDAARDSYARWVKPNTQGTGTYSTTKIGNTFVPCYNNLTFPVDPNPVRAGHFFNLAKAGTVNIMTDIKGSPSWQQG